MEDPTPIKAMLAIQETVYSGLDFQEKLVGVLIIPFLYVPAKCVLVTWNIELGFVCSLCTYSIRIVLKCAHTSAYCAYALTTNNIISHNLIFSVAMFIIYVYLLKHIEFFLVLEHN